MKLMSDMAAAERWTRWQPEEFGVTETILSTGPREEEIIPLTSLVPEVPPPLPEPAVAIPAPLAEEEKHQAWQDGYQQGMERGEMIGHQRGVEEGLQQSRKTTARETEDLRQQLSGLAAGFAQSLSLFDGMVTGRLLQLALQIAWQLCGENVAGDTRRLTGNIRHLLDQDPLFSGTPCLRVHPQDLDVAQLAFGEQISEHGWQLVADAGLMPGDCRLQGEEGELDSSLSARWLALCQQAQSGAY